MALVPAHVKRDRSFKRTSGCRRADAPRQLHEQSGQRGGDVYTRVTVEIVAAIEAGAGTWRMPWHHSGAQVTRPENVASAKRYRGINTIALWAAAETAGYAIGIWGTYRQWQAVGAQVRKGERGTTVILWKASRQPSRRRSR
jgi:antirestriction protein ArdC